MDIDTTHIYQWASEKNLDAKQARRLADATERVIREAQETIQELLGLVQKVEATDFEAEDGEQALGAIMQYVRFASYSNTAQTHLSEMTVQAGKVAGIVESIR